MSYWEDDYPYYDFPDKGRATQRVHVKLKWKDGTTDERIQEIIDDIYKQDSSFDEAFLKLFENEYQSSDFTDMDYDIIDASEIVFTVYNVVVNIYWHGEIVPPTRYDDGYGPEWDVEDDEWEDGILEKGNDNKNYYSWLNTEILKVFQKYGWNELEEVIEIYSDPLKDTEVDFSW